MHLQSATVLSHSGAAHRRSLHLASIFCAALLLLAAPGLAAASSLAPLQQTAGGTAVNVADSSLGQILVDANGMTLYMFDNDEAGTSSCYDGCARRWPPLLVDAGAQPTAGAGVTATLGVTERTDGTFQVTANDMPLYYWFEDTQPGDVLGQAVGDVWWVLGPDGSVIRAAAAAEATAEATMEAAAEATAAEVTEATAEATLEAGAAADTSDTGDMSSAPEQLPTTGADAGTLGALIAALGIAAGGSWVALCNRKR